MSRNRKHPFGNLRPPRAPAALRRRALDAAREVVPAERVERAGRSRTALTDRLWESRPLRLAWALLVVALLGANLLLETGKSVELRGGRRTDRTVEPGPPRTLLESRGAALRALLEDRPAGDVLYSPPVHPRRKS